MNSEPNELFSFWTRPKNPDNPEKILSKKPENSENPGDRDRDMRTLKKILRAKYQKSQDPGKSRENS